MFNRALCAIPRCSTPYSTQTGFGILKSTLQMAALAKQEAAEDVIEVPIKGVNIGRSIRPHELSYDHRTNVRKFRARPLVAPTSNEAKTKDVFRQLFVTELGQIMPRTSTKLTVKSQRRLGKAIRRARMMGVIPLLSKWK